MWNLWISRFTQRSLLINEFNRKSLFKLQMSLLFSSILYSMLGIFITIWILILKPQKSVCRPLNSYPCIKRYLWGYKGLWHQRLVRDAHALFTETCCCGNVATEIKEERKIAWKVGISYSSIYYGKKCLHEVDNNTH